MRLEQLVYLCEVAKRKSMRLASKKLYVSQQSLSTAIMNLEKELSTKLLERTYHGVFPTETGQELIDISKNFLLQLDQLKLKIAAQNNSALSGDLKIAVEPGINTMIMPKVIAYFYKAYPNIRVEISQLKSTEIKDVIRGKQFDIGIIATNDSQPESSEPDLIIDEVIDFDFLARVSRQSVLAKEESISLRTLLNYPLALNVHHNGSPLLDELKKYGKPYILHTHNYGVSQQLVYENIAVSLAVKINNYLPCYFNTFNGEIVDIPIKETLPFHASYVLHKDNAESPIINQFTDVLIKMT